MAHRAVLRLRLCGFIAVEGKTFHIKIYTKLIILSFSIVHNITFPYNLIIIYSFHIYFTLLYNTITFFSRSISYNIKTIL